MRPRPPAARIGICASSPGGDVYFLVGLAASLVQNELYDAEFLRTRTIGFDEVRDVLARVDVAEMARRAGLDRR